MMRRRHGALAAVAFTTAIALVASSCSNSSASNDAARGATAARSAPIIVGALATLSGALSSGFGDIVYGVKAYFDMVNAEGGVNGHTIKLQYVVDDAGNPTTDEDQARNLVEQEHVFAIVGVGSPFFSANQFLGQTGTPTFGYQVSANWNKYPNLFGSYGSVLDYSTYQTKVAWLAKQLHAKSVAVLAYGIAAQSKDACAAYAAGLKRFGVHVGFVDLNVGYEANPIPDVLQMVQAHSDLVLSCMDGPENLKIAQTMHQYGFKDVHTLWVNGYDRQVVAQNEAVLASTGTIFFVQHVPFEAVTAFPGKYPGMQQYITEMNKYEPQWTYDDISLQGWINAAQFVAGLRAAGRNPTQKAVVQAINKETSFTADGLTSPVNWTTAHAVANPPYCGSFVEVMAGGRLEPVFVQHGDQTLVCFNGTADTPIPLPSNTPPSS